MVCGVVCKLLRDSAATADVAFVLVVDDDDV